MKTILISILVLQMAGLMACSKQVSFKSMEAMAEMENKPLEVEQCKLPVVDYLINANVIDYEMVSKSGIKLGFTLADGFLNAFGLEVKLKRGRMNMNMELSRPLNPNVSIVRPGSADLKEFDFRLAVDMIMANVDISYFRQTPMAQLTKAALDNNIKNIVAEMKKTQEWSTFVHYHPVENEVVIPAGNYAGLVLGDRFKVYNYKRIWAGEPCNSEMFYSEVHQVAVAEVAMTTDSSATLKIVEGSGKDIQVGARLIVDSLVSKEGDAPRTLKPSVALTNISSQKLKIDEKNEIDITNYMKEQIKYLLPENGFYLRN